MRWRVKQNKDKVKERMPISEKMVKCPKCHGTRWVTSNIDMAMCMGCQEEMIEIIYDKEVGNGRREA